ncbi:MAG TPA: signal peptidase II [Acidimicrobiales bacterium]|nr:signal peptidase II [Acidimicrobiales bacterium]
MTPARRTLIAVAAVTLLVDAATKAWASTSLENAIHIGGSLSLQLSYNPGVAFGVGQSLPTGVLLALSGAICLAVAWAGWTGHLGPPAAIGLVVGGAVGNLLDRLTGGSVVDMIHLTWWPTFNAADAAICTGAILLVIASLRARPASASDPTPSGLNR